jgi:hypothetical protein
MDNPAILEQIAMYMVALPCPPLPVKVNIDNYSGFNTEDDKPDDEQLVICSSHDLLAGLIICAMHRNNARLNQTRKLRQIEITKTFIKDLIGKFQKREVVDAETFYSLCGTFTADYLQSFDDPQNPSSGILIVPMDDVEVGDKVHKACCSWHVAQEILQVKSAEKMQQEKQSDIENHKTTEPRKIEYFNKLSYRNLILEQCQRLLNEEKMCSDFLTDNNLLNT